MTGDDYVRIGLRQLFGKRHFLGCKNELIDDVIATMHHLEFRASELKRKVGWQRAHPCAAWVGHALVREGIPAFGEKIAGGAFFETAAAVTGTGRQLLLAVTGDDVTAPIADCLSGFFRFGAVGDHIAGADDFAWGASELRGLGAQRLGGAEVGIGSTEDKQSRGGRAAY